MNSHPHDSTNTPADDDIICLVPEPPTSNLPAPKSAKDLIADQSISIPPEVVMGLIHLLTKVVLAGPSKVGKTWIKLYLAFCVATGISFLRWPTNMGRVLFINLELNEAFMNVRLKMLAEHMGIAVPENLVVWNLRGYTGTIDDLIAHIIREAAGKGYSLIIIDPIYKLMAGRSENSSAGVGLLCSKLERLAEKTGAAVAYTHHFAKGNAKKKSQLDRMSGSGVFARDADSIITLTEHAEPNCYTLETTLRNFPAQSPFVVQWDFPVLVERADLDPEDVAADGGDDTDNHGLLELIRARPHTTAEWLLKAVGLGVSRATFFRAKSRLKDSGYIRFNFSEKTWCLAESDTVDTGETSETLETLEIPAHQPVV